MGCMKPPCGSGIQGKSGQQGPKGVLLQQWDDERWIYFLTSDVLKSRPLPTPTPSGTSVCLLLWAHVSLVATHPSSAVELRGS